MNVKVKTQIKVTEKTQIAIILKANFLSCLKKEKKLNKKAVMKREYMLAVENDIK